MISANQQKIILSQERMGKGLEVRIVKNAKTKTHYIGREGKIVRLTTENNKITFLYIKLHSIGYGSGIVKVSINNIILLTQLCDTIDYDPKLKSDTQDIFEDQQDTFEDSQDIFEDNESIYEDYPESYEEDEY